MPIEYAGLLGAASALAASCKGAATVAGGNKVMAAATSGASLLKGAGLAHLLHSKGTAAAAAAVDGTAGSYQLLATAAQHGGTTATSAAATGSSTTSSTATGLTTKSAAAAATKAHLFALGKKGAAANGASGAGHPGGGSSGGGTSSTPTHQGRPQLSQSHGAAHGSNASGSGAPSSHGASGASSGTSENPPPQVGNTVTVTRDFTEPGNGGIVHHVTRTTTVSSNVFEPYSLMMLLPPILRWIAPKSPPEDTQVSEDSQQPQDFEEQEKKSGLEGVSEMSIQQLQDVEVIHQEEEPHPQRQQINGFLSCKRTVRRGNSLSHGEACEGFL
ncbi:spore coat protein SP96 [Cyclospora cayetanensis]|uniref:Spore coat protein SP96 n=1 Tax=Cyclospora cayetanensis TaxID=88456 RepID=A0A6P6S0R9_9EIME|nr:spore coat protein SP96 [Cyclospora cayetanensis]